MRKQKQRRKHRAQPPRQTQGGASWSSLTTELHLEISSYLPDLVFGRVEDIADSLSSSIYFQSISFDSELVAEDWEPLLKLPACRYLARLRFKEEVDLAEFHSLLSIINRCGVKKTLRTLAVNVQLENVAALTAEVEAKHREWSDTMVEMKVTLAECQGVEQVVQGNHSCLVGIVMDLKEDHKQLEAFDHALTDNAFLRDVSLRGLGGKLSKTLRMVSKLTKLDVKNNGLDATAASNVAQALRCSKTLRHLDLSYNYLGSEGGKVIATALPENTALVALNLSFNCLEAEGGRAIAGAMKVNKSIEVLTLNCNQFGPKVAEVIGEALEVNTKLKQLHLIDNGLKYGIEHIADALHVNKTLRVLRLGKNEMGDPAAKALAKALKANSALNTLILLQNNITSDGITALSKGLCTNDSLEILDLTHNNTGSQARFELGKCLRLNHRLENLELHDVNLADEGGCAVAQGLLFNSSLKFLNIYDNSIGSVGGIALANALLANDTLQELNLNQNSLGSKGGLAFANTLTMNRSLQVLHLKNNSICDRVQALLTSEAEKKKGFVCVLVDEQDDMEFE